MRTPDFNNLLKVLDRKAPNRPTLFEFFLNGPLYEYLSGMETDPDDELGYAKVEIQGFCNAGYDYATSNGLRAGTMGFPREAHTRKSSLSMNEGAVITDRESFEAYEWVEMDSCPCEVVIHLLLKCDQVIGNTPYLRMQKPCHLQV